MSLKAALSRSPRLSIATWMILVMLLALLPMLGYAFVVTWQLHQRQQADALTALQRRADIGAAVFARELKSIAAEIHVLAAAPMAQNRDWAGMRAMARRVIELDDRLTSISAIDAQGRIFFDTLAAPGTSLPDYPDSDAGVAVIGRGEVVVFALASAPSSGTQEVTITVPLPSDGGGALALRAAFSPEVLNRVFGEQRWPAGWTGTIIDHEARIVARSRNPQRYLGQAVNESLRAGLVSQRQDVFESFTNENTPVYTAIRMVPGTTWAVSVGQPKAALESSARDALSKLAVAGLLCLGGGSGAAWWLTRTLAARVREASPRAGLVREFGTLHAALETAQTDTLTGLPTRDAFMTSARTLLSHTAEFSERGMALLYLDLDGFKALNDLGGHDAGDLALAEVGRTLSTLARADDVTGRLGGDELALALVVPVSHIETVSDEVADRLIRAIDALPYGIGCSIGRAIARPGEDLRSLLSRADAAMYEAKRGGRNRVVAAAD